MHHYFRKISVFPVLLFFSVFMGCLFDEEDQNAKLRIEVRHHIGGEPLIFDSLMYTNEFGTTYKVVDLEYYLSNITLYDDDGNAFPLSGVYYFNGKDQNTMSQEIGNIEAKHYHKISFVFGLLPAQNTSGGLPNTQVNLNMSWPDVMGGGYHFMRINGSFLNDTGGTEPIATHIGNPPGQENHIEVNPSASIHVDLAEGAELHMPIIMNVEDWFRTPNNYDFRLYTAGIMGNPSAQDLLNENGRTGVFELGEIEVVDGGLSH